MNVILIGFMGSGKTSVGRRLAQRLGYGFVDTDHFIEGEIGCTIAEIFSIQGEDYFRTLETRLAKRLKALQNTVIATGGGMIVQPGNQEHIRQAGLVVFLNAERGDIIQRLQRDSRRPKLKDGSLEETVDRLMAERLPIYEQSDIIIPTGGKSINRVCGELLKEIGKHAKSVETPAASG